jgi:predicted GTPase
VVSLRGSERRPLDDASQRFLSNLLRSALGLHGLPVRLHLR